MKLWKAYVPGVKIQQPMNDMCEICKSYYVGLSNLTQEQFQEHCDAANKGREFYRASRARAEANHEILHLSLDYAQAIHIPHSPLQEGSIFFKTRYKVDLFGMVNEGRSNGQAYSTIFITGGSDSITKGGNRVASYINSYLDDHPAEHVIINMDNCGGQNKNFHVLGLFLARIIAKKHSSIIHQFKFNF